MGHQATREPFSDGTGFRIRPHVPNGVGVLTVAGSSGRLDDARARLFAAKGCVADTMTWFGGPGQNAGPYDIPLRFGSQVRRPDGGGVRRMSGVDLPTPKVHYSRAARVGDLLFLSGQLPLDETGTPRTDLDLEGQAELVFTNLDRVLAAAGAPRDALAQVRVYVTDVELWPRVDAVYRAWLGDHRPARCVVPVPALHWDSLLETEAVAHVPTAEVENAVSPASP